MHKSIQLVFGLKMDSNVQAKNNNLYLGLEPILDLDFLKNSCKPCYGQLTLI
jgi:hypothetical protein